MAFYIFPNALPKNDCDEYLKHCLNISDFEDSTVDNSGDIENIDMIRKTSISFIKDKDDIINKLIWGFVKHANDEFFNYKLSYFEETQFAKYDEGCHYDWHQDASPHGGMGNCRKLSLTFSLSDHNDYEGGHLQFYNGGRPYDYDGSDVDMLIKSVGTVIVFDSRDWHRVTPVTEGLRYSVVSWTVGPNFI